MNAYAIYAVSHLLAQSWQIALLAGIIGLISWALRNRSAHLRYLLWLVVLAKCLVPPFLAVPLAVLPERSASLPMVRLDVPEEYSVPVAPIGATGDPQPPSSAPATRGVSQWLALAWTAGLFLFLLWVGGRAVRYGAWLRARRRPLPPGLGDAVHDASLGFRFRKWPRIWLLEDIRQPFVWGLLRGSVYLPADFVGLSGSDRQRSVLAHELSHVARFDAGVNLLQVLAQAIYWFHPFVWWANRKIRQEREKCCDEIAVAHLRTPPEHYTGAIVDALAAERRSAHPIPSLAVVGSIRDIEERIKTMLKPGRTFRTRPSLVATTIVLLIALVTIPTALVLTGRAQSQVTAPQAADKPATAGEKPEQPRFAARTFNSKAVLDVFVRETGSVPDRLLGRTPSAAPIEIPACSIWWVRASGPVQDWDLLAREIGENEVPGLVLASATDSDPEHLAGLKDLKYLSLGRTQITSAGLRHLAGLKELDHLSLHRTQITDAGLAYLKDLSGLSWLTLSQTQITDTGLKYLEGLTGLKRLFLDGTQVTDTGLAHLEGLTGLVELGLSNTRISDAGLNHLRTLVSLQSLELAGSKVTDAGLDHLKALSTLQMLYLTATPITDAGLGHLESLKRLQELDLSGTKITDAGLEHLKGLTDLRTLYLYDMPITDAGLEHLKDLTQWQWLDLSGTQVTDAALAYLKGATKLERLDLRRTKVGDGGLEHIRNLAGLHDLMLGGTGITDAGLAHLKGMAGLQFLILSGTQTTDAGLAHLQGLTNLRRLHLSDTAIKGPGLVHLQGLTQLQELDLSKTPVTDADVQQLKASLPKLTVVRGEESSKTARADEPAPSPTGGALNAEKPEPPRFAARTFNAKTSFDVLAQETPGANWKTVGSTPSAAPLQIPACHNWYVQPSAPVKDWDLLVQEINENKVPALKLNGATDSDAKHLADLTGLQWLWLQDTEITDAGLELLKALTGLKTLTFTGNQVTDLGLAHLQSLTGLQALVLTGCRVTDRGLTSIQALKALEELGLNLTQITDAGLAHVEGLAGLRYLTLRYTAVTDAGLTHLRGLTRLQLLDLSGTKIDGTGLAHLKDLPRLECLYLAYTQLTDAGLANVRDLPGLHFLWIENTKVTDVGLGHLKGLTGLQVLMLPRTQVTDAGVQQLKQSLPRLRIIR